MDWLYPIWYDIDGTLLHTHAGIRAFRESLLEIFGWEELLEDIVFAGNTDLGVLFQLALKHEGHEENARQHQARFFEVMTRRLDAELQRDKPLPVPGARELVRSLQGRQRVLSALLTGNARPCAWSKLRHAGYGEEFPHGGYGDDHPDRDTIARMAWKRLQQTHGGPVTLLPGLVIGDTLRDIQAARAIGARCLAVASGACSAGALAAAGADRVVDTLHPDPDLIDWILAPIQCG